MTISVSRRQVGLDPHAERAIVPLRVPDDDRPKLALVTLLKDMGIQGNPLGETSHVVTVNRAVPRELR